jgi:hemerythrin-like domain-containing protein
MNFTGDPVYFMLPIGVLMTEHRLIERMIKLMRDELERIGIYTGIDPDFIDTSVDFMRSFSDMCHHGKEEKILFRELELKPLSPELKQIMNDLVQEHIFARKTVDDLEHANESYIMGQKSGPANIVAAMNTITMFYPEHIKKEETKFFYPVMEYMTREEKDKMLLEFTDFESKLIHEKYEMTLKTLEKRHLMPGTRSQ